MAFPVLEKEREAVKAEEFSTTPYRFSRVLKGFASDVTLDDEQRALRYNSNIKDNYEKLMNPEFKRAEEIDVKLSDAPLSSIAQQKREFNPLFTSQSILNSTNSAVLDRVQENVAPTTTTDEQSSTAESVDITPTPTTTQYKEVELVKGETTIAQSVETMQFSLSKMGKVVVVLFAFVVMAIFTLIIINTQVLASLDSEITSMQGQASQLKSEQAQIVEEIEKATSSDTIISWAESNGMTK